MSSNYTGDNKISSITDAVSGTFNYTYNQVDQLTRVVTGSREIETYSYDNYGNLSQKSVKSNDGQGNTVNHVYTYRYKNDLTGELKGLEIGTSNTVRYENDVNGRLKEKTICTGVDGTSAEAPALMSENYYYRKVGDHATNQISTIRYGARKGETLILRDSVRYAYDGMGNITKVYENGEQEVTYEYDGIGRLTRENNKILKKTYLISYDNNGNILSRKEYAYTLKKAEELPEEYDEYTYGYEKNTDKLLEICSCVKGENGNYVESTQTFTYDSIGNPTSYKGKSVTWTKGRQMTGYDGVTFGYNGQGQRISKTKAGTVNKYLYDVNGNLVKESGKGVEYYYDGSGVIGMKYNERVYFYRKDIFGNITEIIDNNGEIVVRYRYDGWGNHVVLNPDGSKNESDTFIGNINPFRYRGYYYDVETGLYYLKTRYYDPEVGRFITIDDISYLAPDTINGLNLYAYCGNNPVMNVDYEGTSWWSDFWNSTIGKIVGTVLVVAVAAVSILTAGVGTAISGALGGGFVASILGGAVGGAISGAVIGAGFSIVTQGLTNGYGNIDWSQVGTATIKGLISGAIIGAVFGFIGASVRGIKILNASRKGLVIGKMGNFESAAKSMNLSYYNGLKGYRLVEKIFGKDLATKIGWAHNKAFVKSVMKLGGAIVDIGGELSGAYAKEVALTAGYQYLIKLTQLLF